MTVTEAAKLLGVSPGHVRNLVMAGKLRAWKPSPRILLLEREAVVAFGTVPQSARGWRRGRKRLKSDDAAPAPPDPDTGALR